ncbi:MAG: hypothetical protein CL608_33855 [Anaerolineaceae bacterium]|nr:hypothetical protein [Anaerolineaceae bacterium]
MIMHRTSTKTATVGAGWRGKDLGKQKRLFPRHLAQVLPIYRHRWARQAGETAVLHGLIFTRLSRPYHTLKD